MWDVMARAGEPGLTLGGVLLEDELLLKVGRGDRLDEEAGRGDELGLGVVRVEDERVVLRARAGVSVWPSGGQSSETCAYPLASEHPAGEIHADGGDHARLGAEEAVVEQGDLHEELGQRPGLDVVVVGLADPAHPRVRRAVWRDVELEAL